MLSETQREEAALLLAEGRLNYPQIAERVGIVRETLWRLRKEPLFAARVENLRKEILDACKDRAIRRKDYRIDVLGNLQDRLLGVIEARAADPELAGIPGADSGLIVRQYKLSGDACMPEYVVDNATIRELRAVQEQAAKELGQLVEKREERVIRRLEDLSEEELRAIASGEDSSGGDQGAGAPEETSGTGDQATE